MQMKQTTLWGKFENSKTTQNEIPKGLIVMEDFITKEKELELLKNIYEHEWSDELKRRVQQYGYQYNYSSRNVSNDVIVSQIPEFIDDIIKMILPYFKGKTPEQLIINEYTSGQGIFPHIDAKVFGDPVISLSLGSTCEFLFEDTMSGKEYSLFLKPRTLVVMSGDSRCKWKHSIPKRKIDFDPETQKNVKRGTRVSLTLRILA